MGGRKKSASQPCESLKRYGRRPCGIKEADATLNRTSYPTQPVSSLPPLVNLRGACAADCPESQAKVLS